MRCLCLDHLRPLLLALAALQALVKALVDEQQQAQALVLVLALALALALVQTLVLALVLALALALVSKESHCPSQ